MIHPAMNLEIDLGLDSLARAEVFAALEETFLTEFEAEQATKALTVKDVIELAETVNTENETNPKSKIQNPKSLGWSKIIRQTDEKIPELASILEPRPLFTNFAFFVYKSSNLFWKLFTSLEVKGIENLKSLEKPFLICPNHQSFLDPFILCSTYPRNVFTNIFHVGASEFFESRFMKWVASMLQIVPVNPDTQLMRAMKAGAIGLKHGKILNIYPEGERAFDGDLHEFKKGAAILAAELDLPILPVALDGVYKVWARKSLKIRPAKVKIRFGKPFYAKEVISHQPLTVSLSDEQKYELITKHLKNEIALLLEELRK
jgi:long-chain acyl-CoA synthetase